MTVYPNTWVLVADSGRARIFELASKKGPLKELKDFANLEGRLREGELTSDRPGMAFSSKGHSSGHPMQAGQSAASAASNEFAKTLVADLKAGLDAQKYERLVLVMPPAFLGQLRSHLDHRLEKVVAASVDKDLTSESAEAIFTRLPQLSGLAGS
jgi:protein required for attachment to host cells